MSEGCYFNSRKVVSSSWNVLTHSSGTVGVYLPIPLPQQPRQTDAGLHKYSPTTCLYE